MHAMWNAGSVPARMIEIISPAGFEHFFRELVELLETGPPGPTDISDLAERRRGLLCRVGWASPTNGR